MHTYVQFMSFLFMERKGTEEKVCGEKGQLDIHPSVEHLAVFASEQCHSC